MAKYYHLAIEGGLHPTLSPAYTDPADRDTAARAAYAAQDPDTDTVLLADVADDGALSVTYFP